MLKFLWTALILTNTDNLKQTFFFVWVKISDVQNNDYIARMLSDDTDRRISNISSNLIKTKSTVVVIIFKKTSSEIIERYKVPLL